MAVITNKQLVIYARGQLGRMYVFGCYGNFGSEAVYLAKLRQYPAQIGKWPKATYIPGYGEKWHDCAGLVKAAIFCKGVIDAVPVYNCNYDYSANGIIELCEKYGEVWDVKDMPKNITGLVMWKPGHMGIWDADTQTTIEAKGHASGVCETTNTAWQKAGKLPPNWVEYITPAPAPAPAPDPDPKGEIDVKVETLRKGSKGPNVFLLQSFLKGKGFKGKDCKVLALDESMGGNTCYAFGNWQQSVGLVRDEICGPKSWDKIANG